MKVSELIERLKQLPQDAEVKLVADWSAPLKDVYADADNTVILDERDYHA